MKFWRGVTHLPFFSQGTVTTVGNFDGVHVGHQALLQALCRQAKKMGLPTLVVIFEPQPIEYFKGNTAPPRLSTLREKLDLLAMHGIDHVCCLRFNQTLASIEPMCFIQHYLQGYFNVRHLFVGEDFRFGRQQQGDVAFLSTHLTTPFTLFKPHELAGMRVSSTAIRHALAKGDMAYSTARLGRPYAISGRVVRGDGRGRTWGIPTANIDISQRRLPISGVFCVQLTRANRQVACGVANVGCRPTVDGEKRFLEVHLFGKHDTFYAERVTVSFLHKLRDEKKFSAIDELIAQIHQDIALTKAYFASDTTDVE